MTRRKFLLCVASCVSFPRTGLSQPAAKPLIGFLASASRAAGARYYDGFPLGMRDRGYVEDRDYTVEYRYADGDLSRLSSFAEELVRLKPILIVASNTAGTLAAKRATASIPIVGATLTDPIGMGLVRSEARPGGNVTGILNLVEGLPAKQLEVARDLLPTIRRVGVLINRENPSNVSQRQEIEAAAAKLSLSLLPVEMRSADEIADAFQVFIRDGADAIVVPADTTFLTARRQIAAFALVSRLPTVHSFREHVEDGGLISYGIDLRANFRRVGYYVDRILKGEKAADLPIEFPTKVELVINLAVAKALGLHVPGMLIARADELIE